MQLSLLDYVPPPEELAPPSPPAPAFSVGDAVRILSVGHPLPQSLIGQSGRVVKVLAANIAQVSINGELWTLETSGLEKWTSKPPPAAPQFDVKIGDRVLIPRSDIWWCVSARLDSGTWIVDEIVREPLPHTRSQRLVSPDQILDRRTKPAIVLWLEAGIRHRDRMHDLLDAAYEQRTAEFDLEAEIEKLDIPNELAEMYPFSQEELIDLGDEAQEVVRRLAPVLGKKAFLEALERERDRLIDEVCELYRQVFDAWESVCRADWEDF